MAARLVMLLLAVAALAPRALAEAFVVRSFDVSMDLARDGRLSVVETIDVEFSEPRRGIFRTIPTVYETGTGISRGVMLSGLSVDDGKGRGLQTKVSREGEFINVRIGDPDVYLDPGVPYRYVIRYSVFGVVNWIQKTSDWEPSAELYWNATGDQWPTVVERASVRLKFPQTDARRVRARVFAGPYGSREFHDLAGGAARSAGAATSTVGQLSEDVLEVVRDAPLPPGSGVTLVLSLPANSIAKPTAAQNFQFYVLPNLGFTLPVLALVSMFFLFMKFGRDARPGPVAAKFEPPDGLSGAECGTLLDERVDPRDLAAGIIALAVKGYLTIEPKDEGMVFKRRTATLHLTGKEGSNGLTGFEQQLLRRLRAAGTDSIDDSDLRSEVAPYVGQLRSELFDSLRRHGYYPSSIEKVRAAWMVLGVVLVAVVGFLLVLASPMRNPLPAIIGGAAAVPIVLAFGYQMPKRTPRGTVALREARGFEEFIRRARGHEFDWMSQKHPDAALFEEYLPHAIAFGLAREWAQAFQGILHEMPSWYLAPHGTGFNPVWFGSDLVSVSDTMASAASTPPRSSGASGGSSGFGGGGFSGGGFGGGGGGSW